MSILTNGEIITEVLVRNNRTTTDGFITDTMLFDWLREAHNWSTSIKPWPFTEGRYSTTFATGTGPNADEWFIEGYEADSIRFLTIGGKNHQKINFQDYLIFRDEEGASNDRVFSDHGRLLYVNPNTDATGTMVAYGQYQPLIDPTDLAAETVFSSWNAEGNEALIEKMTSYLKRREHLPDEAELHDQRATAKLLEVWDRIGSEQFNYQDKGEGIWKRFDVVEGGFRDDISENQF